MKIIYSILLTLLSCALLPGLPPRPIAPSTPLLAPHDANQLTEQTKADLLAVITRREYDITEDQGVLQSPNRSQQLRAVYRPGSLTIRQRTSPRAQAAHDLTIRHKAIFANKKLLYTPQNHPTITRHENHLTLRHHGFSEDYENNEHGIRQNFIVHDAPADTRTLTVAMEVSGFRISDDGANALTFTSENNAIQLIYSDLHCWDADGRTLAARLHGSGDAMQIDVDVAAARFPVTIDPIVANGTPVNASKTMEINQSSAWLGYSVASAGDVNGDGYSEVLVGAPKYDNGQVDEGAAFLFPGTANGLSLAAKILQSDQAGAQAGTSVASAGDFNGDGYSDVLVGAPYYYGDDSGVAFLYFGSNTGINPTQPYMLSGNQSNANFGISVATAGDVNGDGRSDVIVGAHLYDKGQTNEGVAILFYGQAAFANPQRVILEANQANALMGYAVAPAGDVNGDGFSDVLVGARLYSNDETYEGAVFLFRGSASGILKDNPQKLEGNQTDARFGHAVAPAGDVNGDGYSDVVVGAYLYDNGQTNEGAVMIYHGSANGLGATPAITLERNQTEAWLGWSVAAAGDVNGDGYADVLVGARYYDSGQNNEGAAFVYHGSAAGITATPASTIESNQNDAWLGSAVASAGDVNGDGYSDIVVSAYAFDNGQTDEGSAFIYNGAAGSVGTRDAVAVQGGYANGMMGRALDAAGDLNGDGFGDVVVAAPHLDPLNGSGNVYIFYGGLNGLDSNNPFVLPEELPYNSYGNSVSGAGDVNGDGFDDLVVGSFNYSNNPSGYAYVYYGSANGISAANKTTLTANGAASGFGFVVDGGGDLNGDGYADVVVGAPNYQVNGLVYGAAYIFYGAVSGIGTAPKMLVGSEADNSYGVRLAMAGNVNGDNFDDLIIANNYMDPTGGKVFVYHGTVDGVQDAPAITLAGNAPGLRIGYGIRAAGDVNADGFSDILIGAPNYNTNQKAVLVHYGSAAGITANNRSVLTSNILNFGAAVASAGDVNGDGYSDILVGASGYSVGQPGEGAAYIYHGSVAGINSVPAFTVVGTSETEGLGTTVASAGDVNGDGYSDVLVGSPSYFSGQFSPFAGQFQLLYGNNGKGIRNDLRIYNADLQSFYSQNYPDQNALVNFGVGLFAKSFLGRNKAGIVVETRAPGNSFSRIAPYPITTSTQIELFANAYAGLGLLGTESKTSAIDKRQPSTYVRARIVYDPVLSLTGQRFGPWRYLSKYVRGASIAPPPSVSERLPARQDERADGVTIFPNPVSERFRVNAEGVLGLQLVHPDGRVVRKAPAGQQEMHVKGLPAGSYLLLIQFKGRTSAHRVVVR